MAKLLFTNPRARQKDSLFTVQVDDAWKSYMNLGPTASAKFLKKMEHAFRKAMVLVVVKARRNLTSSNALATGFMRNTVISSITVKDFFPRMEVLSTVGTKAWYDILVHEGLGRHSPSGKMPAKYKPTAEQLAIVPASSRAYWKRSPKKPRPFLTDAVRSTRRSIGKIINDGMKDAFKSLGAKPGKPIHDITTILNAGGMK